MPVLLVGFVGSLNDYNILHPFRAKMARVRQWGRNVLLADNRIAHSVSSASSAVDSRR